MRDLSFILYSLKHRLLNSFLSIFLTALGVTLAILINQFGNHIQKRIGIDGEGIDVVVGAKGSPLQLILSSVYHIDIPTGNISYEKAQEIMKHPQIKRAIPLALGDNWKGYRIVGTTKDYIKHYKAELLKGRSWEKDFEAVVGSSVNIKINDIFSGAHGLLDYDNLHTNEKYKVVGVMNPTGTVLDRLILTSLNSVLLLHGLHEIENKNSFEDHSHHHQKKLEHHEDQHKHKHEDQHKHEHENEHKHEHEEEHKHEHEEEHKHQHKIEKDHDQKSKLGSPEITAILITTKSPIGNINIPRSVNRESSLQAANPALEINRLTSIFGLGSKSFATLSSILILISVLSIFSGLASNLENRMGDLAVLRALGYSKSRIFKIITLEGMIIVTNGIILGILLGLFGFLIFSQVITPLNLSQASISLNFDFFMIILFVFIAGSIAAFFPAYNASRISVANQLSRTT